ncbi:MAG: hypothetical protein LCH91_05485 [Bacteroidetes bacterium]|nr:hypothetical protein [Bacteroidota bacterium]
MEIKRLKSSLKYAQLQYEGCPDDTNKLMLERAQAAYDAALDAEKSNSEAVGTASASLSKKSNSEAVDVDASKIKPKEPAKKAAPTPKTVATPKVTTTPPEVPNETPEDDESGNEDGENPEKKTE